MSIFVLSWPSMEDPKRSIYYFDSVLKSKCSESRHHSAIKITPSANSTSPSDPSPVSFSTITVPIGNAWLCVKTNRIPISARFPPPMQGSWHHRGSDERCSGFGARSRACLGRIVRMLTQRIPKPAPGRPGPCFARSRVSRFRRMDSTAVRFGTSAEERRKTQPIQPRLYQALSVHSGQVEADPKAFRPFAKADVAAVAAQDGTGDRKA